MQNNNQRLYEDMILIDDDYLVWLLRYMYIKNVCCKVDDKQNCFINSISDNMILWLPCIFALALVFVIAFPFFNFSTILYNVQHVHYFVEFNNTSSP